MRLHQSWYRAYVLGVPFGTGPTRNRISFYGNMLREDAARRGMNFLNDAIFHLAERSIEEGKQRIEPFRCRRNMLSSQPMAFNLFGPLVLDHQLATACLRTLIPDLESVMHIEIEYAPAPRSEYLDDGTSFDVLVVYRRSSGRSAIIGIETKLTEPFSRTPATPTQAAKYVYRMRCSPAIWREIDAQRLMVRRWFQLWRNHLLVDAVISHPLCVHDSGKVMIVRHPDDTVCAQAVAGYRSLLVNPNATFIDAPLDRLVSSWEAVVHRDADKRWLAMFRERYLSLDRSAVHCSREP